MPTRYHILKLPAWNFSAPPKQSSKIKHIQNISLQWKPHWFDTQCWHPECRCTGTGKALDGGEWSTAYLVALIQEKSIHYIGGWGSSTVGLDTLQKIEICCPCQGQAPSHPAHSHYTDWATISSQNESMSLRMKFSVYQYRRLNRMQHIFFPWEVHTFSIQLILTSK
jgi:hypothetical protein